VRLVHSDEEFMAFVGSIMAAVKNIFSFKRHVFHLLVKCKIGGYNYPLLIDHISREAMYFLKLLQKIQDGDMKDPVDSIVSEEAARDLISACNVVSLISPLLADHVLQEAEYFLEVLEQIQHDIPNMGESIVTCDY
jgi:hypothetical protein